MATPDSAIPSPWFNTEKFADFMVGTHLSTTACLVTLLDPTGKGKRERFDAKAS